MKPWGTTTTEQRFWAKVDKTETCWLWTGSTIKARHGALYGKTWDGERVRPAHIVAYVMAYGPVPEGLELDHVLSRGCTNTLCVRPDHLEAVTHLENVRRSAKAQQTHCIHGHEFTPQNTYVRPNGTRHCKACHLARVKAAALKDRNAQRSQS